jgi:hypothetical protein
MIFPLPLQHSRLSPSCHHHQSSVKDHMEFSGQELTLSQGPDRYRRSIVMRQKTLKLVSILSMAAVAISS